MSRVNWCGGGVEWKRRSVDNHCVEDEKCSITQLVWLSQQLPISPAGYPLADTVLPSIANYCMYVVNIAYSTRAKLSTEQHKLV